MTIPVTIPNTEPDIILPESDGEPDKQHTLDATQPLALQDKRISDDALIMTAKQYQNKRGKLPTVRELTKHANSQ